MSDNPSKDYKDYVRANLPIGMSYNTDVDRYQLNNHSFFKYVPANWYDRYVRKYGYTSIYGVNGYEADLAFDFANNLYFTSQTKSTFSDAISHSRASNATMVDSDGVLKWAPHNLIGYSEFAGATVGVVGSGGALPTGWEFSGALDTVEVVEISTYNGNPALRIRIALDNTAGGSTTRAFRRVFASPISVAEGEVYTTAANVNILSNNSSAQNIVHVKSNSGGAFVTAKTVNFSGSGWQAVSVEDDDMEATVAYLRPYVVSFTIDAALDFEAEFWVSAPRTYRSDLGGMVNNPDTGTDYVPNSTGSARYLPRRGHHVYNGSAWVNEGLLHESGARTNLFSYNNLNDAALQSTSQTLGSNVLIDGSGQGITAEVVATGLENGIPYLDWQFSGTQNGTGTLFIDLVDSVSTSASPGDQATVSGYFKLVSGSAPSDGYIQLYLHWRDASNVLLGSPGLQIGSDVGGSFERFHFTATAPANTTQIVNKGMFIRVPQGATVDFTVRVALLQVELAATPSSPILTSGSTATRAAETLTVPAANLPWPSPVVIGEELVTNGGFDTDSDWTKGTGWTISDGVASCSGSSSSLINAFSSVLGSVYMVSFDVTAYTSGTISTTVGGNYSGQQSVSAPTAGATYNLVVVGGSNLTRGVEFYGGAFVGSIDNISVKEINPLSVSIQMQGEMTYADTGTAPEVIFVDWNSVDDIILRLDTNSSYTGRVFFRQYDGSSVDSVSADVYSPDINVPFNIASRHGSTFINGAVDGTALTANTTPTALPDLSATDLQLGYDFMGTIKQFRIWADDLGDEGIEEASS